MEREEVDDWLDETLQDNIVQFNEETALRIIANNVLKKIDQVLNLKEAEKTGEKSYRFHKYQDFVNSTVLEEII